MSKGPTSWRAPALVFGFLGVGIGGLLTASKFMGRPKSAGKDAKSVDPPLAVEVTASGTGTAGLSRLHIDPDGLPLRVAGWVRLTFDGRSSQDVQAVDENNRRWPHRIGSPGGVMDIYIPAGYRKPPQRLTLKIFDRIRNESLSFTMPPLAPAQEERRIRTASSIPGLQIHQREDALEFKAPIPVGHILTAKVAGSSLTDRVNPYSLSSFSWEVLNHRREGITQQPFAPQLYYAELPQELALQIAEYQVVPLHKVVQFPAIRVIKSFGTSWIVPTEVRTPIAPGVEAVLQTFSAGPPQPGRRSRTTSVYVTIRANYPVDLLGHRFLGPVQLGESKNVLPNPPRIEYAIEPVAKSRTPSAEDGISFAVDLDLTYSIPVRVATVPFAWAPAASHSPGEPRPQRVGPFPGTRVPTYFQRNSPSGLDSPP